MSRKPERRENDSAQPLEEGTRNAKSIGAAPLYGSFRFVPV
jgi:hypothetical protein